MIESVINLLGYRSSVVFNDKSGIPIVFLHGYSFTNHVWKDVGILQMLEEEGIPFLALDMPYGLKSMCNPKTPLSEANVSFLREAIKHVYTSRKPFLVGASLGGYIALRYSAEYPVQGMLLVAPVRTLDTELVQGYPKLTIPINIVYGTNDDIVSLEEMKNLVNILPKAGLFLYKEARHPAYLYAPEDFKKHLLEGYQRSL